MPAGHNFNPRTPKQPPSEAQEVFLHILHTADQLASGLEEFLKPSGLSPTQYNVLRILRGAGETGLTCGQVAERMLTRDPDITRLMDRLAKRGLVSRRRQADDRRVVRAFISPDGLTILGELDQPILDLHEKQLSHLGKTQLKTLARLLESARGACE